MINLPELHISYCAKTWLRMIDESRAAVVRSVFHDFIHKRA